MHGGDGGLQGEAPRRAPHAQRPLDARGPARDRLAVPERAVLVLEQDQRAPLAGARRAPRVVQRHEGEEPRRLGLVGHQVHEHAAQADRLLGEVVAAELGAAGRDVPLGEDERDHGEHHVEALGQALAGRHLHRDARVADLALRPHQPLGDRGRRQQQRPRHLGDRQPGDQPQGQGHLRVAGECWVTAREDQPEPLVGDLRLVDSVGDHLLGPLLEVARPGRLGRPPRPLAAQAVDRPVARGREDPGQRRVRRPVARPAGERDRVGVLQRVLGAVDVAEGARQDRQRPPVLLADDAGDGVAAVGRQSNSMIGRTSTLPVSTLGMRRAASMAWSSVSHSIM